MVQETSMFIEAFLFILQAPALDHLFTANFTHVVVVWKLVVEMSWRCRWYLVCLLSVLVWYW